VSCEAQTITGFVVGFRNRDKAMPIIGFMVFLLFASNAVLAQDQGAFTYSPGYCDIYNKGIGELVGLENTFRRKDPDDLKDAARKYGTENVGNLYAVLSQIETILLELRVTKYSRDRNFSAPFPGDAADYNRCLAGKRLFLD
jgi:hypothetical protein